MPLSEGSGKLTLARTSFFLDRPSPPVPCPERPIKRKCHDRCEYQPTAPITARARILLPEHLGVKREVVGSRMNPLRSRNSLFGLDTLKLGVQSADQLVARRHRTIGVVSWTVIAISGAPPGATASAYSDDRPSACISV